MAKETVHILVIMHSYDAVLCCADLTTTYTLGNMFSDVVSFFICVPEVGGEGSLQLLGLILMCH